MQGGELFQLLVYNQVWVLKFGGGGFVLGAFISGVLIPGVMNPGALI